MAGQGSMNKQNQRQSQKNKSKGKHYGLHKVRMHEIPLICTVCGKKFEVTTKEAYKQGGNFHCKKRMLFFVASFPKVKLEKHQTTTICL